MKKATVLLLTLVLILSLSLPALAFTAMPSAQNLSVDGRNVECEKYNIDGSNYFKLRDIAYVLNGTGSQFSVGWDAATGTVSIVTGEAYAANGSELVIGEDKSATTVESSQTIMINGEIRSDLTVYNIGGSNFFKLRELGDALGFDVDYDSSTSTAIIRSRQPAPPAEGAGEPSPVEPSPQAQEDVDYQMRKTAIEGMERYYTYLSIDLELLELKLEYYRLLDKDEQTAYISEFQELVSSMWDNVVNMQAVYDKYIDYVSYYPLDLAFKGIELPMYLGSNRSYISDVRSFRSDIISIIVGYEGASDFFLGTDLLGS